jgi:YD repeat-containing protein
MERARLQSSNIREVGYDADSRVLEIIFADGDLYHYFGVPESIYRALLTAPSAGRLFHQKIRDTYRYAKL